MKQYLFKILNQLEIIISDAQADQLIEYFVLLREKNKMVNLISLKQDLNTQICVHLVDSLTPLLLKEWPPKLKLLDLGSGGGLPGIPLSIIFPEWLCSLAEATGKKTRFLEETAVSLALKNVFIINKFFEPDKNIEKKYYDLITVRAVSNIEKLAAIAGPRLKPGGQFLAFKGPLGDEEFKKSTFVLKKNNLELTKVKKLIIPDINAERYLYLFTKI